MKLRALIVLLCGAIFLTFSLAASASAATRSVPSASYPTIQSGVDAAQNGDTVLVADGTYTGTGNRDIDFHGKSLTVTSQNGPTKTIIDCGGHASTDGSGDHRGFYIHSGETNATISGFTVKNGYTDRGGGIYIINFSGTKITIAVTNCTVTANTALFGGGILNEFARNGSSGTITLTNCTVSGNTTTSYGGGGICNITSNNDGNGTIILTNCTIAANTAVDGGGIYNEGGDNGAITLTNCTITANTATDAGGGIYNANTPPNTGTSTPITLTNCTITANTATDGGGAYNANDNFGSRNTLTLTNCTISANTATDAGGGVYNLNHDYSYDSYSTLTLINCTISANTAQYGGGAYNENTSNYSTLTLINCTITTNFAVNSGGGVLNGYDNYSGSIMLTNDIIYGDFGGEVTNTSNTFAATVTYSDVQNGSLGIGNINATPLFLNTAAGDLHLKPGSPCLGAGTPIGAPPTDKDGNPRPSHPSIGAYDQIAGTTRAVLLVHGTFGNGQAWHERMLPSLEAQGFIVEAVDFPTEPETRSNEAKIEDQAAALKRRIGELITRSGQPSVDLVCHSMGGLAARYYLEHQELWQTDAHGNSYSGVSKLVMLGTPNWGTDSPELDPVAGVSAAHLTTEPLGAAVDTYADWSPAVSEQFAEWEPAPDYQGFGSYSYPAGYQLYQWPSSFIGFSSPINPLSYLYDDYVLDNMVFDSLPIDYAKVLAVTVKFPIFLRLRNLNHLSYYPAIAHSLGVMYPSNVGTHGVNNRLVSPFLFDLNQHPVVPGVKYYLVAGTNPIASFFFTYHSYTLAVPGPFTTNMGNDGIVPTLSELGIDPLTHQPLFPDAEHYSLHTYHADLPNNADVVSHVINWLSQ